MSESKGTAGPEQPERDPEFEAQFAQLVEEVEKSSKAAVEEPSARARMLAAKWREQPPPSTPWRGEPTPFGDAANEPRKRDARVRVWPRNLAIAVIAGALAIGGAKLVRHNHSHDVPTASLAGATPSPTQPTSAGASAATGAVSQIPVSRLFPKTVHGSNGTTYTLVTAGPLNSCVNTDMVGPTLAGMFAQSNGCVGGEGALYKDSAKDQFNMTVFTLKDPADTVSILTELSMNPGDFEVGALQPPAGSGLTLLSATSGIIQQFASSGHYMGVFMAQWADGRAADYASLQQILEPLQDAVSATMKSES